MEAEKKGRQYEISKKLFEFCKKYLNEEYFSYAEKLLQNLCRKRKFDITKGRTDILAAGIMTAIARLNFLFDKNSSNYISQDDLCAFFQTNKSTTGSKALQIMDLCKLHIGEEGYCSQEITDTFTYYETPEGFIVPKSMIKDEAEQARIREEKEAEKKRLQEERKQKAKELKEKDQLRLFD